MVDETDEKQESEGAAQGAADDIMADWAQAMAEQSATETRVKQGDTEAAAAATPGAGVKPVPMPTLDDTSGKGSGNNLDMILDIPVTLSVELGRTKIQIRSLLQLAQGSVVELERLAGEPMDVLVNGYLIAQGEVVLVNDKFGIRLTDIVSPAERATRLRS